MTSEDCNKCRSINPNFARTICSICYDDLKPILEDLQSISICGHVFHELCLQQWLEYCPAGKKSSCPVCKQACSEKNISRLYFQSLAESTQSIPSQKPFDAANSANVFASQEEVKKLERKISGLNSAFDHQQQRMKELTVELSLSTALAKKEEMLKEEALVENARIHQLLLLKTQDLIRSSAECSKLQERSMALAKELATLKLVSDVNLEEEEVSKLASIGGGANGRDKTDILKKSLILRNNQYKELMARCNLLGRGESRSLKKLEKAEEKIKKLKTRLQEVEKVLEEKDNEVLRALKATKRTSSKGVDPISKQNSYSQAGGKCSSEDQTEKSVEPMGNKSQTSSFMYNTFHFRGTGNVPEFHNDLGVTTKENNNIIDLDLETDSFFDEDAAEFFPVSCERDSRVQCLGSNSGAEDGMGNKMDRTIEKDVTCISHQTPATNILPPDIILDDTPLLPIKRETPGVSENINCPGNQCFPGGLLGPEGSNRYLGKWCKRNESKISGSVTNGNLIAVGADGRGGRIKVLRAQSQLLNGGESSPLPKRCKNGAKQSGQSQGCLQLEHFFVKKERS
ncbi:RING/U-box superfamily protein [Tasmannia lanceolata]|uniref:RING/U-box superfamily protein n=1 Tax=Tasmannia lanceolata TaxID=3420 RepID=UPI004064189E